jgi:hypothetical protein
MTHGTTTTRNEAMHHLYRGVYVWALLSIRIIGIYFSILILTPVSVSFYIYVACKHVVALVVGLRCGPCDSH